MNAEENRKALDEEVKKLSSKIESIKTKPIIDETDYLLSSKSNRESLDKSIKELESIHSINEKSFREQMARSEKLTRITMSDITPISLLDLGFNEEYQKPECGAAGFLYYSLEICGVGLLSTSIDDDDGFYVFTDDDTIITDYNKLMDVVTSLRAL